MTTPGGARRVVLALGSNLGDRLANLQGAVDVLGSSPDLHGAVVSPVYETVPVVGRAGPPQPDYANAVLVACSSLPPAAILALARKAEAARHRVRAQRWGPRTLDVDVIVVGDEVSEDPELTLPHPRAHQRAFVLVPWHDMDPGAEIPGRGKVADLLAAVGTVGVQLLPGARLRLPGAMPRPRGAMPQPRRAAPEPPRPVPEPPRCPGDGELTEDTPAGPGQAR
jgi:2-amino-4-hydroxy-6-hydroxymethyldihydropteridine diphosphokinase